MCLNLNLYAQVNQSAGLQKMAVSNYHDCLSSLKFTIPDKNYGMVIIRAKYNLFTAVSKMQMCLPVLLKQTDQ